MSSLPSNTPVIVGVGFRQVKSDNPTDCPEAIELMYQAISDAALDAGNPGLVTQIESIAVQKGSWAYRNPGKILAEKLNCFKSVSILSDLGVLQIMPLFELCEAIAKGEKQLGVVTGGESRYRDLRSMITGQVVENTVQDENTPAPDIFYETPDPFSSQLEQDMGIWAPNEFYAIAESAIRFHKGVSLEQHRLNIAKMYSGFSEVASKNPHAWRKDVLTPEEIATPDKKNQMISYPYTKSMLSQWNVNQSVAIIVCSLGKAKALGLNEAGFIYPLSASQSRHVTNLSQKKTLHTHPGTVLTGKKALELANLTVNDIQLADLYSCFPSAIQACAADLELPESCPVNITGTMAYAGGPFNHGALDSVARMVEVLREQKNKAVGMVTNLSGMFGKQGCGLFSNQALNKLYEFVDVTAEVAKQEIAIPINRHYVGPAKIVAYSVMYNKGEISHAIAYCDTPEGERTVVRCNDQKLCEQMTQQEFVGKDVLVIENCEFTQA